MGRQAGEVASLRLPAVDRKAAVVELRRQGMSQSAIAATVGVSQKTISDDLATNSVETTELNNDQPVLGLDGRTRTYPARRRRP